MQQIALTRETFKIPPMVYMVQNDTGRVLKMSIRDAQLAEGDTAIVAIRRSDGSYYSIEAERVSGENAFTADMSQALTQSGQTECQLKVTSSSEVVSTYTFIVFVQESTNGVPQEQLGVSAQDLINAANQLTLSDNDVKLALLQIAEKVVYVDPNGQQYYDALEDALYPPIRATGVTLNKNSLVFGGAGGTDTLVATISPYNVEDDTVYWGSSDKDVAVVSDGIVTAVAVGSCTITATCGTKHASASVSVSPATLLSISATYTQSGTVYTTDTLDSLEADLVVIANWSSGTQTTLTSDDYILSGTLTAGTSVITVLYGDKSDTFNVVVTAKRLPTGYTEYEYIKYSSGTWAGGIIADLTLGTDYVISTSIGYDNATQSNPVCVMGTRAGNNGTKQIGLFVTPSTGKLGYWYGGTDTATIITTLVGGGSKNTIVIKPVGVDQTFPTAATITLNGTVYNTGSSASGQTWSSWFGLFCYATSATSQASTNVNINAMVGEIIVTDSSNNTVYDLIPCYNGTYYGFYDSVNEVFYTNTGEASRYTGGNWS